MYFAFQSDFVEQCASVVNVDSSAFATVLESVSECTALKRSSARQYASIHVLTRSHDSVSEHLRHARARVRTLAQSLQQSAQITRSPVSGEVVSHHHLSLGHIENRRGRPVHSLRTPPRIPPSRVS